MLIIDIEKRARYMKTCMTVLIRMDRDYDYYIELIQSRP